MPRMSLVYADGALEAVHVNLGERETIEAKYFPPSQQYPKPFVCLYAGPVKVFLSVSQLQTLYASTGQAMRQALEHVATMELEPAAVGVTD